MTTRIESTGIALSIVFMFLLFGCAASRSDLVEQAQLTGDWSLVNKRDEAMDRHKALHQSCRGDTTKYCEIRRNGSESCSCVSNSGIEGMIRSMQRNTVRSRRRR